MSMSLRGAFPEPLVAPPDGHKWTLRWSSEHPDYEGCGTQEIGPTALAHFPVTRLWCCVPR